MLQDLRYAVRLLARERWFTVAVVVALGLGIGVNATGFSLVNGVLLRERSLRDDRQTYVVSWLRKNGSRVHFSRIDFERWRPQSRTFEYLGGVIDETVNLSDDRGLPEQASRARVTLEAFDVFGLKPLLGRRFELQDLDAGSTPVAIVAHHVWKQRYGEDPAILGATLRLNGTPLTIVGVMPEGVAFPGNAEVWTPIKALVEQDGVRQILVFGRLNAGASRREGAAEASTIARRIIAAYPEDTKEFVDAAVETVPERFVARQPRTMFQALMIAGTFVLLIACANVANLLLARSAFRSREIALRMTLGASRARVIRQLLIESVVRGCLGGALGLWLAYGGIRLFDAAVLDRTRPYWILFTIDVRVVTYVIVVCVLTAIVAGIAPAFHVSNSNRMSLLKEAGGRSLGTLRTRRFSGALVVGQLALTIVLLSGAGLMVRSFYNLRSADIGYRPGHLVTMRVMLPGIKYPSADVRRGFYEQLEPRIAAVAGIESVAMSTAVPPLNQEERLVEVEGIDRQELSAASVVRITPSFFEVLGEPLRQGRNFEPTDARAATAGVIVNERFIRQFFGSADPIGRRLRFVRRQPDPRVPSDPWRTIVGVSPSIRHSSPQDADSDPVIYVPLAHEPPSSPWIMVRTQLPAGAIVDDIRRAVQSVDRDQPVFPAQTIEELLGERRWPYTAFGGAFAVLALVALVLAALGLYALMAYSVSQRTPEIGVRMALGATARQVSWLFLRHGLLQLAVGLTLGLAGAYALSGVLRTLLVRVEPGDPLTLGGAALVLSLVAVAACIVPVRRATAIDPAVAIRSE